MHEAEFLALHKTFADSLHRYVSEADRLCESLSKCALDRLSLELRSEIANQRSAENQAHAEYNQHRIRLLEYAKLGYGIKS
jgi:hypothetical protein